MSVHYLWGSRSERGGRGNVTKSLWRSSAFVFQARLQTIHHGKHGQQNRVQSGYTVSIAQEQERVIRLTATLLRILQYRLIRFQHLNSKTQLNAAERLAGLMKAMYDVYR